LQSVDHSQDNKMLKSEQRHYAGGKEVVMNLLVKGVTNFQLH